MGGSASKEEKDLLIQEIAKVSIRFRSSPRWVIGYGAAAVLNLMMDWVMGDAERQLALQVRLNLMMDWVMGDAERQLARQVRDAEAKNEFVRIQHSVVAQQGLVEEFREIVTRLTAEEAAKDDEPLKAALARCQAKLDQVLRLYDSWCWVGDAAICRAVLEETRHECLSMAGLNPVSTWPEFGAVIRDPRNKRAMSRVAGGQDVLDLMQWTAAQCNSFVHAGFPTPPAPPNPELVKEAVIRFFLTLPGLSKDDWAGVYAFLQVFDPSVSSHELPALKYRLQTAPPLPRLCS